MEEAAIGPKNAVDLSALQIEAGVPVDEELAPCPNCGRTFVQSSLVRHIAVCSRSLSSRRGKFDSSKQRIQGTELEQYLPPPVKNRPRSRSVPAVSGGPRKSLIPQQAVHKKCEHCGRSFGDKAIDRHQEWCKKQQTLLKQPAISSPAYARMQARTQYKAPLAKTMRSRTREKYSPSSTKETSKTATPRSSVSHPPNKTASIKDTYHDVFRSAERQMQELLGSPLPSRKSQPYVIQQKADIELNLDESFIKAELRSPNSRKIHEEDDSSIEDALNEISHQDSFSSIEIFKDEPLDVDQVEAEETEIRECSSKNSDDDDVIKEALQSIKKGFDEAFQEQEVQIKETFTEESVLNHLKATLDGTLDNCPLTESLNYLDAALSLFQLDDIPMRPSNAPRSRASTKRRQYSVASPLTLLKPDPEVKQQLCSTCGTAFPMSTANFCCLCGTRRSD
ncbi:uncharacterized protein LOC132194073 [Neocloeon triangulifer]|uniref:uncharacterized protein LOC132194073 n=1 Tax=Neocloeon triangulifer TaxID=2078957 RepID=UPI00286F8E94|nr:uncharacterized protein LOC132194073 [Neocloeon triangulifer]XP_059471119.1 uncharacterized protein LOC132194073 [Neocloeon triangulifer]